MIGGLGEAVAGPAAALRRHPDLPPDRPARRVPRRRRAADPARTLRHLYRGHGPQHQGLAGAVAGQSAVGRIRRAVRLRRDMRQQPVRAMAGRTAMLEEGGHYGRWAVSFRPISFRAISFAAAHPTSASGGGRGGALVRHPHPGARGAEFEYKLATGQDPTHPVNIRAQEALNRIREATGGKLDIKLFPANQLGSDTDLLSQVSGGSVEFFNQSTSILSTFVPVAGILNTGFAFTDYDAVWKAMDGDLGTYVRAQIAKTPIMTVSRVWDNGFRQITSSTREIRTPDDLKGFKIRVPPAPMLTSLFKALDAGPAPINFNELYSALQTKVVEGQENPLADHRHGAALRGAEILQPHRPRLGRLLDPRQQARLRATAGRHARHRHARNSTRSAMQQRADIAKLSVSLRKELEGKGITFIEVDRAAVPRGPVQDDASTRTGKPSSATRRGATWRSPRANWYSRPVRRS